MFQACGACFQCLIGSILAGAGNEGKLLKSSTSQDWNILFDSPEIAIVSLALMSRNTVLAGTAPDGLIYKIQLGKTPEIFASTGQHYVWGHRPGSQRNNLRRNRRRCKNPENIQAMEHCRRPSI